METLNLTQSCVLMCTYVDLSEERPSRISKTRICTRSPYHGASGLVPDVEQESALKETWVSASEGENGLTRATWRHRSISASREDPAPGAAQTAHCWVGIREGRGPCCADSSAGRLQEPPPHLLRPETTLQDSVTLEVIKTSKEIKAHSKDPQVNQGPLVPWGGSAP